MVADPLVVQIGSCFRAYGDGFHARSGAQIADFFSIPCISIRGGAAMHWFQSRAELENFFQGVADTYYEEGLRKSEIKNLELVLIGGVLCWRRWTGCSIAAMELCSSSGDNPTTWFEQTIVGRSCSRPFT